MESIFKPGDLDRIKAQLKELDEADKLAEMAIRAGIDVSAERDRIREARASLTRIRSVFYPNQ